MGLNCALHFAPGAQLATTRTGIHKNPAIRNRVFATLRIVEVGEPGGGVDLYFYDVRQIETLVEDLQKLGNDLAAKIDDAETDTDIEEAGECRACHRAVVAGAEYCGECEAIASKIEF